MHFSWKLFFGGCSRLALFGVLGLLLAAGCNWVVEPLEQRYLFRPWNSYPERLKSIASLERGIEEVNIRTPDGVTLHGWLKHPPAYRGKPFPLVIVFGGVRRETSWLIDRVEKPQGWGWLFVNYRGYGLSEGVASERILLDDAKLIYDYAAARTDVDSSNIVVLGRSLGSYFSVVLARERQVRGAILATPFDSFVALGAERYPWLPLGLLLNGRYDALSIAPNLEVPALFVIAERDNVTPPARGAALAKAWGGPRRLVTLAGARHYGIERRPDFWNAVAEFLLELESDAARKDGYAGALESPP